jgi:hypothetical protein
MRSELNEIQLIDRYLFRQLSTEDTQTFEASLMANGPLAERVEAQRITHRLVRLFARKEHLRRFEAIYQQLLQEPAFARQLKSTT